MSGSEIADSKITLSILYFFNKLFISSLIKLNFIPFLILFLKKVFLEFLKLRDFQFFQNHQLLKFSLIFN